MIEKVSHLTLETPRLLLRNFQLGDEEDCFAFLSDAESCLNNGFPPFETMDEEYALLMERYAAQKNRYMVVLKGVNRVIGTVILFESEDVPEALELGYTISPQERRKGYCTEALQAVMEYCFTETDIPTLTAGVFPGNPASVAVLKKLGFHLSRTVTWTPEFLGEKELELTYYTLERRTP